VRFGSEGSDRAFVAQPSWIGRRNDRLRFTLFSGLAEPAPPGQGKGGVVDGETPPFSPADSTIECRRRKEEGRFSAARRFMKLIVGLGNPGEKYAATRHNVGFWVIDRLAERWQIPVQQSKWKGLTGSGRVMGEHVVLLKPMTYMNLSGESVRPACDWLKCDIGDLVVLYDDMDLPLGQLRLRKKGSSGGHRGMQSLIHHLETQEFKRIKIGIGRPETPMSVPDYVLSPFTREERPLIEDAVEKAAEAVHQWVVSTFDEAMNRFNRRGAG
jgi:PTH1 family peptidyl-tRNA hydrolase